MGASEAKDWHNWRPGVGACLLNECLMNRFDPQVPTSKDMGID